jgi:hypothetical protein
MNIVSPIQRFWTTEAGLSALLACVVVNVFVLNPFLQFPLVRLLTHVLFALILVFGVMTIWERRGVRTFVVFCAGASLIFHWIRYQAHTTTTGSLGAFTALLFCVVLAYLLLARVFQKGEITFHRVMGAVTAYLFLGMAWAMLYEIIELNWPGAFQMPVHSIAKDGYVVRANFFYFSFVTLTTLGYGDIVAVLPAARMLALLEALTGQLFPAVLIARLVSMEIQSRGPS